MKKALKKWSFGPLQITSAAVLGVMLTACQTPDPEPSSSSSSSWSSSSTWSSSSSSTVVSSSSSSVPAIVSLQDKCETGFAPHSTNGSLPDTYAEYTASGQTDATLRPEIIQWMEDHAWQEGHFLWHENRRCSSFGGGFGGGFGGFGGGFGGGGSSVDVCSFSEFRPPENECQGPQDGYEFLVMHRHMINVLTSLWPSMDDQFKGWDRFPTQNDYPDILRPYFNQWNSQVLRAAEAADGIANMSRDEVLQRWPDEGTFGQWIQCGTTTGGVSLDGLHGALHFNGFPQSNQDHGVSNPRRNLDAYLFWKLHGWIDNAWESYRQAVGVAPNDSKLQAELVEQCKEHHFWAEQVDPSLTSIPGGSGGDNGGGSSGVLDSLVRPAFQAGGCLGCHGSAATAGLNLGSGMTSQQLVQSLVNVNARNVQGYALVVPGDPDSSWLYLKATGASQNTNATCAPGQSACKQAMSGISQQGLDALRQWIIDGATAQ